MELICALLKDLGYAHVVGVLDGDKTDVKDSLSKRFGEYWFTCIPTHDVRDKEKDGDRPPVQGLCDTKGCVHEEHRDVVRRLFQDIASHLGVELTESATGSVLSPTVLGSHVIT